MQYDMTQLKAFRDKTRHNKRRHDRADEDSVTASPSSCQVSAVSITGSTVEDLNKG